MRKLKPVFRSLQILWVFLTHLVLYRLNSHRKENFGKRLGKSFQALGVVFVKIGQILSGRYDLLKEADLAELRNLLDNEQPLPDEAMFSIIAQELGQKTQRLHGLTFLSSASIAQVYQGMLDGKESVVVKVLKPGIKEQAATDLAILYGLARIVEFFSPTLRRLKLARTVSDMRLWIMDETDLENELQNVERFRSHLERYFPESRVRDLGKIIVPKTYKQFSTARILTMERLEGITANEWMRGKRPASNENYDPRVSVSILFVSAFRPLFIGEPCLFHGDPHPANVIFMVDGNLGLIDFGLLGKYSEELTPGFKDMFVACFLQDAALFTESLIKFTRLSEEFYDELYPDVEEFLKDAVDRRLAEMLVGLLGIIRRHKIYCPMQLSIMVKFNLLADSLAEKFCPDYSVAEILAEEFALTVGEQLAKVFEEGFLKSLKSREEG